MTKILFISNDPEIFNAESAVRGRLRAYAGYADALHVLSRARLGARETHEGALFLHPLRVSAWLAVPALTKRAREIIRERDIDIVSAQDPFEHGLAAYRAVTESRAKLHLQVHTDFLSPFFARESFINRARARIADSILPRANGIRAVSKRVKDSLVARYGARIREPSVLPLPVERPEHATPLPPHPFRFALVSVGRLEKEKRFGDVIDAVARVSREYPSVGLFIVGSGRLRADLENRVRAAGLSGRVLFLGARPDAAGLIGSATAYVQASAYEGYGATLIEAALARVPIITTDVGIVGDVLTPDVSALVSAPRDVSSLAEHIRRLVEDNQLRHSLAFAAAFAANAHLSEQKNSAERIMADIAKIR